MRSDSGNRPISVSWTCEEIHFPLQDDITKQFEQHLLNKQAREGWSMVGWKLIGNGVFEVTFDKIIESNEETVDKMDTKWMELVRRLEVSPWQLFMFYYPNNEKQHFFVPKGEIYTTVRRVEEYADYWNVGDPINLIDVETNQIIGSGKVVGVKKTQLCDLAEGDYDLIQKGKACKINQRGVKRYLSEFYQTDVTDDEVVSVISIRAETDLGQVTEPRRIHALVTAIGRFFLGLLKALRLKIQVLS